MWNTVNTCQILKFLNVPNRINVDKISNIQSARQFSNSTLKNVYGQVCKPIQGLTSCLQFYKIVLAQIIQEFHEIKLAYN